MLLSDLSGPRELVPMAKLRINDASLPLLSPGISSIGKQRKLKKEKKAKSPHLAGDSPRRDGTEVGRPGPEQFNQKNASILYSVRKVPGELD